MKKSLGNYQVEHRRLIGVNRNRAALNYPSGWDKLQTDGWEGLTVAQCHQQSAHPVDLVRPCAFRRDRLSSAVNRDMTGSGDELGRYWQDL